MVQGSWPIYGLALREVRCSSTVHILDTNMNLTAESHRIPLSNGNSIPLLGLGTYGDPQTVRKISRSLSISRFRVLCLIPRLCEACLPLVIWVSLRSTHCGCSLKKNQIKCIFSVIFFKDTQRHCIGLCQAGHRCGLQALWWGVGIFQRAWSGSSH